MIDRIRQGIRLPEGVLGIGDDCAILPQKDGIDTLVSTDMLVEGSHFLLSGISPYDLGWKSAAVNISDLAAMGARPVASFLSLALSPEVDAEWMDEFIRGYRDISDKYSCALLGGDRPERLIFTGGCTDSLNMALQGTLRPALAAHGLAALQECAYQ